MSIDTIGYGAGDKDFNEQGNILRLLVGTSQDAGGTGLETDKVDVLETNLDDVSGEIIAHCVDRLLATGALDVYSSAIQMKKGRPAVKLTVLCTSDRRGDLERILFEDTGTLGVRHWVADRRKLPRSACAVETPFGSIDGKVAELPSGERRFTPEYESCRLLARDQRVPIDVIYAAAQRAFGDG